MQPSVPPSVTTPVASLLPLSPLRPKSAPRPRFPPGPWGGQSTWTARQGGHLCVGSFWNPQEAHEAQAAVLPQGQALSTVHRSHLSSEGTRAGGPWPPRILGHMHHPSWTRVCGAPSSARSACCWHVHSKSSRTTSTQSTAFLRSSSHPSGSGASCSLHGPQGSVPTHFWTGTPNGCTRPLPIGPVLRLLFVQWPWANAAQPKLRPRPSRHPTSTQPPSCQPWWVKELDQEKIQTHREGGQGLEPAHGSSPG